MNKLVVCFVALFLGYFAYGCQAARVEIQAIEPSIENVMVKGNQESKIVGSEESTWEPAYLTVAKREKLEYLRVFDNNTIYIVGAENHLYKTVDGGKSWRSSGIRIPSKARISDVLFIDPLQTVVSVIRPKENSENDAYDSLILATKNGGKVWAKTFVMESTLFNKMALDSEGTVWLVGAKVLPEERFERGPLLATSKDLLSWREIPVTEAFKGSFDNILIRDDLSKILVDWKGRNVELDRAMKWSLPDSIDSVRPAQIGISNVGEAGNKFFMLGATGGREGRWTSIFSKSRSGNDWGQYTLKNISLNDLIVVSPDELVACGLISNFDISDSSETANGVILHSVDGGLTWLLSHRSSRVSSFNSLGIDNKGSLWAIGEKGTVLNLKKVGDKGKLND